LLDLSDPSAPAIQDTFTTPGDGTGAILQGDRLFAADGLCGVRALDLNGRESGYWRGVYASDIAVLPDGDLLVADAAGLVRLRYLPEGEAIPPPLPAQPVPAHGSDENGLLPTLSWGPEPDPCDGLRYDLYLGTGADPAQIAQGLDSPSLALSQLEPLRTYYWRVEAVDRQGERRVGPTWQFTTLSADITDSGPPVTANFLAALLENPGLPLSLILLMVAGSGYGYWRWQSGRRKRTGNRGQQDSLH
jgi:hypothetical protein